MNKFKIAILSLLISCVGAASAQEGGKREVILPKAGDVALGVDLAPYLSYLGNFFNDNADGNTISSFGGEPVNNFNEAVANPSVSIIGKYMYTDDIALRVNFGMLYTKTVNQLYSYDDVALINDPLSEATVIDEQVNRVSGASIAVGAQYRRGYNRIQGYAAIDALYAFGRVTSDYTYGNAISEVNQVPSRNIYEAPSYTPSYWTQGYVLESGCNSVSRSIGAALSFGVEYFFASHVSIGGEVSYSARYTWCGEQYQVTEGYNTLTTAVESRKEKISPGSSTMSVETGNLGGKLYMMFYF